jgi:predicted ATP-grasp superfamily ATP-dependent carboligase
MYDLVPHTKPLLVTGTATGEKTLQEVRGLNVRASTYEGPTSIAAVISQEANKVGIETMGMVAHLPQYAQLEEDHSGRLALLEVLSSMYNLDMDLDRIRRRATRQYEEVSSAMNRSPEVKSLVERLEQEYESRATRGGGEDLDSPLSPEVEDFLNQMGDRFNQN